jgi:hypothetical protein
VDDVVSAAVLIISTVVTHGTIEGDNVVSVVVAVAGREKNVRC